MAALVTFAVVAVAAYWVYRQLFPVTVTPPADTAVPHRSHHKKVHDAD